MNTLLVRGYSLVEMAIALVVLGLLLSSVLVPLQVRFKAEDRKYTIEAMENARQAVVGYAIANRTANDYLLVNSFGVEQPIPAGRPYLPCPDITGDGLEDREDLPGVLRMPFAVPADTLDEGGCVQSKGLLPWRTLGLQTQVDAWGRQLGYRVDLAFSSQLFGFDEDFRADIFTPRAPVVRTVSPAPPEQFYALRAHRDQVGALVCSNLYKGDEGGCPPVRQQNNLLVGVVLTINATLDTRNIPAYDSHEGADAVQGVVNGAAFVIFSHGENGWGGINRSNQCLFPPPDEDNLSERANAFYRPGHPFLAAPFSCTALSHDELAENLFVSAPFSSGTAANPAGFDDIVIWSSPHVVSGMLLESGVFPIPKLTSLPSNAP